VSLCVGSILIYLPIRKSLHYSIVLLREQFNCLRFFSSTEQVNLVVNQIWIIISHINIFHEIIDDSLCPKFNFEECFVRNNEIKFQVIRVFLFGWKTPSNYSFWGRLWLLRLREKSFIKVFQCFLDDSEFLAIKFFAV